MELRLRRLYFSFGVILIIFVVPILDRDGLSVPRSPENVNVKLPGALLLLRTPCRPST